MTVLIFCYKFQNQDEHFNRDIGIFICIILFTILITSLIGSIIHQHSQSTLMYLSSLNFRLTYDFRQFISESTSKTVEANHLHNIYFYST